MSSESILYSSCGADIHYGSSEAVVSRLNTDDVLVVDRAVAQVLDECTVPRTVDAHVAHLSLKLRLNDTGAVKAILDACIAGGLLEVVEVGLGAAAVASGSPIACLAVATCDRPEHLRRCLESYRSHYEQCDREVGVVVVDGSRTAAGISATESVARSLSWQRATITYLGPREREQVRLRSIRAGFAPEEVEWLMPDPPPYYAAGATRNVALLATAGQRILAVDDDTVCCVREHHEREHGIAFVGHLDVRETTWFHSRKESTAGGLTSDVDLTAAHGAVLGSRLKDLTHSCGPVDLTRACKHLLRRLRGGEPARVRCSWLGIAGDSASYCPHGTLFCGGSTRDMLATNRGLFDHALRSREVFRTPLRLSVTDDPGLMAYCVGLDNTDLLPPFSSVGLNEDGLFGWMLRVCDPSAFIIQLPYAIVHDSSRPATYSHEGILTASQIRTCDVVEWLCQPWLASCVKRTVTDRIRSLAAYVKMLGELNPSDFRLQLKKTVVDAKLRSARRCDTIQKEDFAYPGFWERALMEYKRTLLESISDARFYLPIEWNGPGVSNTLADLQRHLLMYGRALDVWPDLWAYWRLSAVNELVTLRTVPCGVMSARSVARC